MDDTTTPSNSAAAILPNNNQVVTNKKSRGIAGKILMTFLVLAVFALGGAVYYLYTSMQDIESALEQTNDAVANVNGKIEVQKSWLSAPVDAKAKQVYIPELSLAVPYSFTTRQMTYSIDEEDAEGNVAEDGLIRISSRAIPDYQPQQMGCDELLLISTKDIPLINPWMESAGSVKLANGTTLYIQASKAFANNEGSTEYCAEEAWIGVTPSAMADAFKKAVSY